jgi:hypothetical protein
MHNITKVVAGYSHALPNQQAEAASRLSELLHG